MGTDHRQMTEKMGRGNRWEGEEGEGKEELKKNIGTRDTGRKITPAKLLSLQSMTFGTFTYKLNYTVKLHQLLPSSCIPNIFVLLLWGWQSYHWAGRVRVAACH